MPTTKPRKRPSTGTIKWEEVFIPYGSPELTFVERKNDLKQVREFLSAQHERRVLCIQGPSQSGKTQLIDFALRAAPHLRPIRITSLGVSGRQSFVNKLSEELDLIDPVPNPDRDFYRRSMSILRLLKSMHNSVLVLDDFHRIPPSGQREIFDWFKEQSERPEMRRGEINVRFCVIYIPNKSSTAPSAVGEFTGPRVIPVKLQLWNRDDLISIAQKFFTDKTDNVVLGLSSLADAAYGLPSMMQLLCLNYCKKHHQGARPGQTFFFGEKEVQAVIEETAEQAWSVHTYHLLTAHNALDLEKTRRLSSRDKQFSGTIYQMIWYAISTPHVRREDQKLLKPLQYREAIEIPLSVIQQRVELLTGQKLTINDLRKYIEFVAGNAETQYRRLIETEITQATDPLFELVGERLYIYSPQVLFQLSYARSHLEYLRDDSE